MANKLALLFLDQVNRQLGLTFVIVFVTVF